MTIIELKQGYYSRVDGCKRDVAVKAFAEADANFLAKNPQCALYHRPSWCELQVPDDKTAPWGHEWYVVGDDGVLRFHSAQYDSSG